MLEATTRPRRFRAGSSDGTYESFRKPEQDDDQSRRAVHLEWSEPKLWRIETGQTSLRSLDVEAHVPALRALPRT